MKVAASKGARFGGFIAAAACAVGLLVASGCQRSNDWNPVFHRSQGWLYADGGSSVELADGKRVWLFGDSMISHENGLVFNTIAVSEPGNAGGAPDTDGLRFLARAQHGELLDISQQGKDGMRPWLEPPLRADGTKTWLWPTDAVMAGNTLVAFYSELGCIHGTFPACRSYLGNMGFMGHRVMVVDNPGDEPEAWKIRSSALADRRGKPPSEHHLHWGSALVEDGGWLYVFGTGLDHLDAPEDVKLARVVPDKVARYDLWQFLTADGWRMFPTGASSGDLQSVARGGATELSVDRVERDGKTWFVMVQVDPYAHEIVARSAAAEDLGAARWNGPEPGEGVRRLSIRALDPAASTGMTWSGRAVRRRAPSGEGLLVSYFSASAASLRFVELPLSNLRAAW